MPRRLFSSDLHLGHRNIGRFEPARAAAAGLPPLTGPASDAEQEALDRLIIDRWRAVVGDHDEVWLLGDAVMGQLELTLRLLGALTGRIVLVPGNHDRVWQGDRRRDQWLDRYREAGVDEIVDGPAELTLCDGTVVSVDHFPYAGDSHDEDRYAEHRPVDHGGWLLHGHVHSKWQRNQKMVNVGVDVWGLAPVAETTIVELITAGV